MKHWFKKQPYLLQIIIVDIALALLAVLTYHST